MMPDDTSPLPADPAPLPPSQPAGHPPMLSAEQMRIALEGAGTGLWFYYPESNVVMYSAQMKRLFDHRDDETAFTYESFLNLLLPEERDHVDQVNRDAVAQLQEYELEYRIRWRDGSIHWINAKGKASFDHEQQLVVFVGTAREITHRKKMERDLAEASRIAHVGTWNWDILADKVTWSDETYRIFGRDPAHGDINYESVKTDYVPASRAVLEAAVQRAVEHGIPYELDMEILLPDGGNRWITVRGQVETWRGGRPASLCGTVQDITERKQIERSLQEAHRIAGLGHWAWDVSTGNITWSEQNFRNWRMNPADVPLRVEQILARETPASRARHQLVLDRIVADGTPYEIDIEIVQSDGTTSWMAMHGEVAAAVDGRPTQLRGTAQEITERKRVEIALQESEQRTRLGVKVASLALAEIDYTTGINHLSAEAARMFGIGNCAMSVPRATVFATFHPQDREELHRHIAECLDPRGTGAFGMDHRIVWPNGEVRWLRVREQVYFQGEGEARSPHRAILAAFDITDSRNIQAALLRSEKLASVGRMASTIAHEINNPLETIGQSVYLALTDSGITDEGKHYLELATHELERAALITRQTLAFTREASSPAQAYLKDKVENVLNLFAPRFRARGVKVETRYRSAVPILGFASELRQVLANLLSNSLDATPSGGTVYVRVADHAVPDASRRVRLIVADTGIGISPEHKDSIFEAFFTTKEIVGTGLGLWVTRQILEKHGASVHVRSTPGRGTVFSLSFPAAS